MTKSKQTETNYTIDDFKDRMTSPFSSVLLDPKTGKPIGNKELVSNPPEKGNNSIITAGSRESATNIFNSL